MSEPRFRVPASKSELIRALLIQGFEPSVRITGHSDCEDVRHVRGALASLTEGQQALDLGDSGLGFRCLALRASRHGRTAGSSPGWFLKGTDRLLSRPHDELQRVLEELGCQVRPTPRGWTITPPPGGQWARSSLQVSGSVSSQFASAVLLSALDLARDFTLEVTPPFRSQGYLSLTVQALRQAGVNVHEERTEALWKLRVPARSRPVPHALLEVDGDWSTAFGLAAVAAFRGPLLLQGLSPRSGQPDRAFVEWLTRMGVPVSWQDAPTGQLLRVERAPGRLRAIQVSAQDCPDLAPVFSVLASLSDPATGTCVLHSAPQLRAKESDRITQAVLLARFLGARATSRPDGFEIQGTSEEPGNRLGVFSSNQDHRQVMAAFVAHAAGFRFPVHGIDAIRKSAPEFLDVAAGLEIEPGVNRLALLGHRGVGKTTLLGTLKDAVDLDSAVEASAGIPIPEIFRKSGEPHFRQLERETFLRAREARVLALGAGFEPDAAVSEILRRDFRCVRVARPSDASGRIFLDRPRLDDALEPLAEFEARRTAREERWARLCDESLVLSEGDESPGKFPSQAKTVLEGVPSVEGTTITIPAHLWQDAGRLRRWVELRQNWPYRYFEIRDDQCGDPGAELLGFLLDRLGPERLLLSRRLPLPVAPGLEPRLREAGVVLDWALELGQPTALRPGDILSLHDSADFALLEAEQARLGVPLHLKSAPQVSGWEALARGHAWASAGEAEARSFHPRSADGRWAFYRLWSGRKSRPRLVFVREDQGSAPDQPTVLQWLENPGSPGTFGAVLGDPVSQSRSPRRHGPHFYAIRVRREEWNAALPLLTAWGLRRAAVTSPLKTVAASWLQEPQAATGGVQVSERARALGSVNTLHWPEPDQLRAENTDWIGLHAELQRLGVGPGTRVVLWGGGGMAPVVRSLLPQVLEFSARTGQPRQPAQAIRADFQPEVVIWAVGRSVFQGLFPPPEWQPRLVLDLNTAEDSPGREYALRKRPAADPVSGLGLFEAQARAQIEFWS